MQAFLKLKKNNNGRDFSVGDIHGCFSILEQALKSVSFDPAKDRLICVGDLINRGPESSRALEFIEKDWFYSVRGNHEDALKQDFDLMNEKGIDAVREDYTNHGLGWMLPLSKEKQKEYTNAFEKLPYAIEVPLKSGEAIGFTHAEVPKNLSWQEFTKKLEQGDNKAIQTALYGRSRIKKAYENGYHTDQGVAGISKLFTGHSIAAGRKASQMGNWFCIDTGAVMRFIGTEGMFPKSAPEDMHLTLVNIEAKPEELSRQKPHSDTRPFHSINPPSSNIIK